MSYISETVGRAVYEDDGTVDQILEKLTEYNYDNIAASLAIQRTNELIVITLPHGTRRNFGRNTHLLLDQAIEGYVIGTSVEPHWHGFIDNTAKSTTVRLEDWQGNPFNHTGTPERHKRKQIEKDFFEHHINKQDGLLELLDLPE